MLLQSIKTTPCLKFTAAAYFTIVICFAAIVTINAKPAKFDTVKLPTILLEPPQYTEDETVVADGLGDTLQQRSQLQQQQQQEDIITAFDSYGNPVELLTPIDTPDGRKIVSAQGVQFEIPTYASGITDIRKPANELLPPNVEPIAVAEPNSDEGNNNVQPEEINTNLNGNIPQYLLELNDSDIGGPVDYIPIDNNLHKFISWDLLPPEETPFNNNQIDKSPHDVEEGSESAHYRVAYANKLHQNVVHVNHRNALQSDNQVSASTNTESENETDTENTPATVSHYSTTITTTAPRTTTSRPTKPTQKYHRGSVHYTNSTPAPTTTARRTTPRRTTSTRRATSTTTTTTTTTPTPTTTTTTTTSTPNAEASETDFYRLENGDSYTLPPWLTGLDYADLDVAVTFIVPTDNNEYNHTIDENVLPPLEPFVDLKDISLPAPATESSTKSSTIRFSITNQPTTTPRTTTPTTTRKTTSTTARSYWIQTYPTTTARPSSSHNSRVTQNHLTHLGTVATTSSTTRKPNYKFHTSFNTIKNNGQNLPAITASNTAAPFINDETAGPQVNPFLVARQNSGITTTTPRTSTASTTTTTTTTSKSDYNDDTNPFAPTLPVWLEGLDYADLGPAVPYNYDANTFEQNVVSDLQAPFRFEEEKPAFLINTHSQIPSNKIPAASTALTQQANSASAASTIFTTKVTAPTSIQTDAKNINELDATISADNQQNNFPVPFDDDSAVSSGPGQSTIPVKTTFIKGEGGKVITNTPTIQTATGQGNPFLPNRAFASSFAGPTFKPTPSQRIAPTASPKSFSRTTTYKNRFGGPPGILRPYDNVRG